jgi:iron(III) transport system substrate-binding protein
MRKYVSDLKLDPSLATGLDDELRVPDEWIAGAKKEGTFRITGSWDPGQFRDMTAPFVARYPFLKPNYSRGSFNDRAIRPLLAFQDGRYIADIVSGIGGAMPRYVEAHALDDLRVLPNAKNVLPGMKNEEGRWIGIRIRYWCMSYNTSAVSKADLPKTWDDLLTNPRWRNGRVGLANLPQLWMLPLWAQKGGPWAQHYLDTLFNEVKPQIRREGANALVSLVIAGELDAAIPSADYRVGLYVDKGAPIAWHCPTPVPSAISEMAILKGNPNIHAARLFANWLLSKEGQIAQFHADGATPIHKDLQTKEFLKFPGELADKPLAFRNPELEDQNDSLLALWNPLWTKVR